MELFRELASTTEPLLVYRNLTGEPVPIARFTFINTGAAAVTFKVYKRPKGQTIGDRYLIYGDISVAANTNEYDEAADFRIPLWFVMPNQEILIECDTADVGVVVAHRT